MKNIAISLLTIGLFLSSCADSYLDPKPHSFYTPENAYTDAAGFEALALTMRKNLKRDFYAVDAEGTSYGSVPNAERHFIVTETNASDVALPYTQPDFSKLTPSYQGGVVSTAYFPFVDMFIQAYVYIKDANVLLSRIDHIEWKDKSDRDALVAEALFHRAYWYYRLVNNYGNVPAVFEEITKPKLDFETHSRWRILDKLEKDLEFAAQKLPQKSVAGAPTKGAANHLLTKVYLANMKFDKAIESATRVIDGGYALMTSRFGQDAANMAFNVAWDLQRPANIHLASNTETILGCIDRFEAPSVGGAKANAGTQTMRNYHPAWWNQTVILDRDGKPGMTLSLVPYTEHNYWNYGRANPNCVNSNYYRYDLWNYKGDTWQNSQDYRRADTNWVDVSEIKYNNPQSKDFGLPVNTKYIKNLADTFFTLYGFPYYKTYYPCPDIKVEPKGSNGDWYVFRLAETYLLRAEAHVWLGNKAAAAADINKVRSRAHAKLIENEEADIEMVFDERARELFAEEPRHSELSRVSYIMARKNLNGYSEANFGIKNWFHDRVMAKNNYYHLPVGFNGNFATIHAMHVLWPIPQSIIIANTKKPLCQNYGYEGYDPTLKPLDVEIK